MARERGTKGYVARRRMARERGTKGYVEIRDVYKHICVFVAAFA